MADQWPLRWQQARLQYTVSAAEPVHQDDGESQVELYTTAACLAISALTLLAVILAPVLPRRPRWATNFIREEEDVDDPATCRPARSGQPRFLALVGLTLAGLGMQAAALSRAPHDIPSILQTVTWAIALVLVALASPPAALLVYACLFASQLACTLLEPSPVYADYMPPVARLCLLIAALTVMLGAPLRSPRLSSAKDIAVPFAPPDPKLRSPEDNLTLWQWMTVSWMAPLLSRGRQGQLHAADIWFLPFEFHHRKLHHAFRDLSGSVLRRLLLANGLDLVIVSLLGLVELASDSLQPVLLQQLLKAMEDPHEPRRTALIYALLTLFVRLIAGQSNVFGLWYGRRAYERSRGEMITMLYEKTLSRKLVASEEEEKELPVTVRETDDPSLSPASSPPAKRVGAKLASIVKALFSKQNHDAQPKEADKPASSGKILNLMRNDVYEVSQRFWEFKDLVMVPLQLVVVVILIWKILGLACLLGALSVVLAQIVTAGLARVLVKREKLRRGATDQRLQIASQFVEAIRHLRWYGWQDEWRARIMEKRQHELDLLWTTRLWQLVILLVNSLSSVMFPMIAFYAYTVLTKQPLRVDVAFPAMNLFQMLDDSLRQIPQLLTMYLNARVALGRIETFMGEADKPALDEWKDYTKPLQVHKASFAWPDASRPLLTDLSLSFSPGMTVIGGKVGAGKTALLLGLLGELDLTAGRLDKLSEAIGYCEQRPWLQSMSIRENILFHTPYDEVRYKAVLEACMLNPDLDAFKHGDMSNIGENGVGLSGGQKSRVALARAVYSPARVLLLDDPLSSLDHQTAESIVRKCFAGPLMKGRTLILVTHRLDLCRLTASKYIEIADGHAHERPVTDLPELPSGTDAQASTREEKTAKQQPESTSAPDKFIEDEHRAHGGIPLSVYWVYIKAGRLGWWLVLLVVILAFRMNGIGKQYFLKEWGEAYDHPGTGFLSWWPSPLQDINPWLWGFFVLSLLQAILRVVAQAGLVLTAYFASQKLFQGAIQRVAHSTFRFYDVTPVGRLMNRITSDMGMIDGGISMQFQILALLLVVWVSSLVVVASVAPPFLLLASVLVLGYIAIFRHFLPTSQSLRRLETTSLSPLISDFGALVDGLTTVRAFAAQYEFQSRVIAVTDEFQRMDHFYWSLQAWLMYRIDALSASTFFVVTLLGVYSGISPGLVAFALLGASQFVSSTHNTLKLYGQLQMDFVSVERVVELIDLEQEAPGDIVPAAIWPSSSGDIVFDKVTLRYAAHLEPALTELSLVIKGGTTTAVIGRTGSGKSTLAAALLATITPDQGRISIDGVDLARVDKQALRSRVTFLAQDPVLFPGKLRQNLDPLRDHSDDECERVLQRICPTYGWTLDTRVESSGRNFSQGQRQLIGLARAVLRRSAIVVLDEATASIDMHTSATIQDILRHELQSSTVITIAHRAEAVRGATSCVVLGDGRLVEHRPL